MKNFNIYDPMKRGQGLMLDGQTLAHIEILQNSEGTEAGSLLKLLGRCVTPSGMLVRHSNDSFVSAFDTCSRQASLPYMAVYASSRSR